MKEPENRESGVGSRTDRRSFLLRSAAVGASALVSACGWKGGPFADDLASFSRVNDRVSGLLFSQRLAREYPVAQRTPTAWFPSYHVSNGTPMLQNPAAWLDRKSVV